MASDCRVVLDSISPENKRLITFEGKMHRFVLSEFNTHRKFSRNSASSRAIPIKKQIQRILDDTAMPVEWGANQPGMQASELISEDKIARSKKAWLRARDRAVSEAEFLDKMGVHKQIANRILEPFMWHTVVFTTTTEGLENFFNQRCTSRSPLAQPEMRAFADKVLECYDNSFPSLIQYGDWHTPYIQPDESFSLLNRVKISSARCARVSYLTQNGIRDFSEDLNLYDRLVSANPRHESPLEHPASPSNQETKGNFDGWAQWRHSMDWVFVDERGTEENSSI